MMAVSQKRKFTFTWQIQNFSMCPQKFKEDLLSPVFVVRMLDDSEWQLKLYPKGEETDKEVSCYLLCASAGSNAGGIQIGFCILVFSDNVTKLETGEVKNYNFEKGKGYGFPSFISRDTIFGDEDAYLPNNTLTIKCSLWRSDNVDGEMDFNTSELKDNLADVTKYNIQDFMLCDDCTVITRVQVQRKTISWPIRNFSTIDFNERLVKHVPSLLKNVPSFSITFKKSIAHGSAEIQIRKGPDSSKDTFVKCKVSVFHTSKGIDILNEDEHLFGSNVEGIWKFPLFIKLNILEEDKYFNRTCDVLHLRLDFSFSQPKDLHHMENVYLPQNEFLLSISHPNEELGLLYKDGEHSDVTIRVGDQEFKVHKIILMARSPVIRAMFDNDMKEKESGVIGITDVDPDTVDRMLTFMYTNAIRDLPAEDALKLYSAADKYEVLSLKVQCAWILASSLSVSNVCRVLTMADQYDDEYLFDCAEGFIQSNSLAIFKSQEWENFILNNGTVAAKVMFKMLTN